MDKRPYILGHYKEANVKKVLKVIDDLSNDDLEINEMAFYILYIFNEASKNGYITCNEDYLENKLLSIYDKKFFYDNFDDTIDLLIRDNEIVKEEIQIQRNYYLKYYYDLENSFAERIGELFELSNGIENKEIEDFIKNYSEITLNVEQKHAVSKALSSKMFLFNSISNNCIIIITGDYRQPPSIGVGTVFKDLIDCEKIPYIELKDILRQKSSVIIQSSYDIIEGIGFDDGLKTKKVSLNL